MDLHPIDHLAVRDQSLKKQTNRHDHEKLNADLEAFLANGGRIEQIVSTPILAVERTIQTIGFRIITAITNLSDGFTSYEVAELSNVPLSNVYKKIHHLIEDGYLAENGVKDRKMLYRKTELFKRKQSSGWE